MRSVGPIRSCVWRREQLGRRLGRRRSRAQIGDFAIATAAGPSKGAHANMSADLNLVNAAFRGDVQKLRRALAAGANPNFRRPNRRTSLQVAALYAHLEAVTFLLSAGAHVDATSTDSSTALFLAVFQFAWFHGKTAKQCAIIKALVAAGADVHARNNEDRSPFTLALIQGHRWIILEFLRAGAVIKTSAGNVQVPRSPRNASAWALVDAVKKAGGFEEYARRLLGIHVSVLTKCFGTALPVDVTTIVAGFYAPRGFY